MDSGPQRTAAEALCELEAWLAASTGEWRGLDEMERESERRGREVVRRALQAHLDAIGDGDAGEAIIVEEEAGPVRLAYKRLHSRSLVTVAGEVTINRVGYAAPGRDSVHPLDAALRLPGRCYSYELQRRLVRLAVCSPFDEAVATLEELTGVKVPKRSAEQVLIDVAADFEAFYQRRADAATALGDADIVVGAIDCKGIPMVKPDGATPIVRRKKGDKANKKKMATVAAVFSQPPRVRTPEQVIDSLFATTECPSPKQRHHRPTDKRVWASLVSTKDDFITDVRAEMDRRDLDRAHTWVIVTDGERALQRRVTTNFDGVTLVLDLLHVMEKCWKAAHALYPEGSPEATAFVRERARRILNGQVSQVVKGLRQIVTKRRLTGTKANTLRSVADYFYANRSRMAYDEYLAKGWPIASGSVEGACKTLVRDRFERSGMRWVPDGAEAMLKMRAIYLSDDLNEYWPVHTELDQQRLYPPEVRQLVAK
ncbi:MAG: ISKra4 family transposase [Acidimicrobiales bacterium]